MIINNNMSMIIIKTMIKRTSLPEYWVGGLPGLLISELGIIRRRVISHDLCYNP